MFINCHSYFSLRYGTIPVAELVQLGKAHGVKAMALTDINAMTGVYEFVKECQANDIKPVVGIEFRNENHLLYIALAKNTAGFAEVCSYLTEYNLNKKLIPNAAPAFKNVFVVYPYEHAPEKLKDFEFIGIRPLQMNNLPLSKWRNKTEKLVVLQSVVYRSEIEFNLHQILRAIDNNTILSKLSKYDYCSKSERMVDMVRLAKYYKQYPEIIANTDALLAACSFDFDFRSPKNKKCYTDSKANDRILLEKLAFEGLIKRYANDNQVAKDRLKRELQVVDDLDFLSYFLITWDIIQYSNSQGHHHVGRGSGANSIVAYCLGITDICPIELNLYFERFLNPSRSSPPDFDIDWSWQVRDEILTYIFTKYGKDYVGFTGTIVEFKYKSIFRELGKVFGLADAEIDTLTKNPMEKHEMNGVVKQIHKFAVLLVKYPNQLSMHSCGILISEEKITNYTVMSLPPKGFPTVQIDMNIAEDIGLEKLDILSQRGLGHIKDCVELIKQNQGIEVDIRNTALSKDEAKANSFLKTGNTIGCFYIESPAMRGLNRKLNCDNYLTLVAASSIIRPGVAQSGMMSEFVFRHNNPDKFEYNHPVFEEQLGDTYGIMVYQEDVLKIAHAFAGLSLAEADILRRMMSGKKRSQKLFNELQDKFYFNCRQKGYSEQLINEVFKQIESFAGYSFCKAHSASYAVESYQSLYLKAYYPIEFMVAVINNFGGFYRTEVYFHEAKMAGGIIHSPCVNMSNNLTILYGKDIYIGFIHIERLEEKIKVRIAAERRKNGNYRSLEDFINRVPIGVEMIQLLIFAGAFRFTGKTKSQLIFQARSLLINYKPVNSMPSLFCEPAQEYELPNLPRSPYEDAFDEYELFGFFTSCSPFDLLLKQPDYSITAKSLINRHNQKVKIVGYLISTKHVPTKNGSMFFGTWVDIEGTYFDTAHFANSLVRFYFKGGGCYELTGKVNVEYGFPTITITEMHKLPFVPDPRYEDDKDMKYKIHDKIKQDVSETHRAPYPSIQEIGLPRHKIKVG